MGKYLKSKIAKRLIDGLKPDPAGRIIVIDTEIPGFRVLVLPTGIMSYRLQYQMRGVQRELTIGRHGDLTPDEARKRAHQLRAEISAGRDPLGEKQERAKAVTVAEMLDAYLAGERFGQKAPATQLNDRGRIERHLKPLLGRRFADSVTPNDVERARAAIKAGKTAVDVRTRKQGRARVSGGETAATDTIVLLRSVYNWAIGESMVKSNPAAGLKLPPHKTRDTILESTADYARMFAAIDRLEQEGRIRPQAADAIRLISLTGSRKSEIVKLRWEHVDLKRGEIVLPAIAHKSGRQTGRVRTITLPAAAMAILSRQSTDHDLVFAPARGTTGPMVLTKPWAAIKAAAELPAHLGLHGLRHSLASHLAMGGASASELQTALGHKGLQMVARYSHFAENARQALAERAAAPVIAGMAAASGGKSAEVVRITDSIPADKKQRA